MTISVGVILRQSGVITAALVERMAPEGLWELFPSARGPRGAGCDRLPTSTDCGKKGSKIHLIVDRRGLPLSIGISVANLHDSEALIPRNSHTPLNFEDPVSEVLARPRLGTVER